MQYYQLLSPQLLYIAGVILLTWVLLQLLLAAPVAAWFRDKPEPRKIHRIPIPRLGGVVFITIFSLLAVTAYFSHLTIPLFSGIPPTLFTAVMFASLLILVVGFFDDTNFVTVRVRHKLAAEAIIAIITVYLFNINIGKLSFLGLFTFPFWFSNIISFFWILGLPNAFNFVDGLDGLAGTLALISLGSLAIIAGIGNQPSSVFLILLLSGAVTGFLIHNFPPAKVFMGDTGSIFLGTMVAILSLYVGRAIVPAKAIIIIPLIAGIPLIEVLITMVRRFLRANDKKRSFAECIHSMVLPDNSHIHHRLTYKGYSAGQSIGLISLLAITLCSGAICTMIAPVYAIPIILAYLAIPVYITLYQLGFGGRFHKALHLSPTRYNGFKKSSLIGVIDREGSLSHKLEHQIVDGVAYIRITEQDIPALYHYLRAAVVREQSVHPDTTLKKAEEISALLRGPVYVIDDTSTNDLFVREVSRNGSLSVNTKTTSINELLKDFQRLSSLPRIQHHSGNIVTITEPTEIHQYVNQ